MFVRALALRDVRSRLATSPELGWGSWQLGAHPLILGQLDLANFRHHSRLPLSLHRRQLSFFHAQHGRSNLLPLPFLLRSSSITSSASPFLHAPQSRALRRFLSSLPNEEITPAASSSSSSSASSSSSSSSSSSNRNAMPWWRNPDILWFLDPRNWPEGISRLSTKQKLFALLAGIGVAGWFWALLATTTIFSLVIWLSRTLGFQKWLLEKVGGFVASTLGYEFSLESAHVLGWSDGYVVIRDVRISSRPEAEQHNEAIIDIHCDEAHVKLSLTSLLWGNGILKELHAKDVKGSINRSHVVWDPNWTPKPRAWGRNQLDLEGCTLRNAEITIRNPHPKRELELLLFDVSLPRLRQQWLLFDILTAEHIYGSFDGSLLFFRHIDEDGSSDEFNGDTHPSSLSPSSLLSSREQRLVESSGGDIEGTALASLPRHDVKSLRSSSQTNKTFDTFEIRLMGLNMDMISSNVALAPLCYINEGQLEVKVRAMIPLMHKRRSSFREQNIPSPSDMNVQVDLELRSIHADMPDVPISHQAYIRPLIVFLNTNYTLLNLSFPVLMNVRNFDGAVYPAEAKLYTTIGVGIFRKIDELMEANSNIKSAGHWTWFIVKGVWHAICKQLSDQATLLGW